jgi:flavin-dependent thymidylate synthase
VNRDDNADRMGGARGADKGSDTHTTHHTLPVKWADRAQYHSAAMPDETRAPGGGTRPTVTLLNATPDPLGSLAALCGIYEGKIVRRLTDVTDDDREAAWKAMRETVLNGPLESIQFHFLIEGVTRAFTHQAVRNRFSFFAQESMRFAVVDEEQWLHRQAYPPSLAAEPVRSIELMEREEAGDVRSDVPGHYKYMSPEERDYAQKRDAWDDAILVSQQAYQHLVAAGVPAEEARGIMPHSMTTRYHWVVSIRTLLGEAGKRLCTQAQFEWRVVMAEVVKAMRAYADHLARDVGQKYPSKDVSFSQYRWCSGHPDHWQLGLMADALQPICYQEGHCGFMAKFDRGCTIRERVNRFAANNVPSSNWQLMGQYDKAAGPEPGVDGLIGRGDLSRPLIPIHPKEWLADPSAART